MTDPEAFDRAFVAVSCLFGRREDGALGLATPGPGAIRAGARLLGGDRADRAQKLAAELAPIVAALAARRLG